MQPEIILKMEGICKSFPGVRALDNVDFVLRKGEIHALMGENGAGKSTLIKIITGVYQKDAGQAVYEKNRANCKRQLRIGQVTKFLNWAENKMRDESWSPDVVVGYAQLHRLFKREEMVCAKTLYSYIDRNLLKIRNIDLPLKTRRKPKRSRPPAKRTRGRSIDERPPSAEDRTEFGHWEIDTVQGKKSGDMALLTLTERKTRLHLLLPLRSCCAEEVDKAVKGLTKPLGSLFRQVFKTTTADNGTEFSSLDRSGLEIYFSHPYSAWERGTNERHNGLTRRFIPKGKPIKSFSADHIRRAETLVNNLPRKILGYRTPLELFQEELSKLNTTVDCTGFAGHVEKTYNEVKGRVRNYEREQISQKV